MFYALKNIFVLLELQTIYNLLQSKSKTFYTNYYLKIGFIKKKRFKTSFKIFHVFAGKKQDFVQDASKKSKILSK